MKNPITPATLAARSRQRVRSWGAPDRLARRHVIALLVAHALITWSAVAFRVDHFPLTWAPMYAVKGPKPEPEYREVFKDRKFLERHGWLGVRRDGGEEWIRRADVNVPRRSMWRLYYQRTWQHAPPKHGQKNAGGWTLDRWIRGLPPGAPIVEADWQRRLLVSINETLGRAPSDPGFIERLRAERARLVFGRDSLELERRERETVEVVWRDAWSEGFD